MGATAESLITVGSTDGGTPPWEATVVLDMDLDSPTLRPTLTVHLTPTAITTSSYVEDQDQVKD